MKQKIRPSCPTQVPDTASTVRRSIVSSLAPGGKETGQKVSHYIIAGGAFAQAFTRLKASGFEMRWQSRADGQERQKKAASKTYYTCPQCNQNAWAKPGAALICGMCYEEDSEIHVMESEYERSF